MEYYSGAFWITYLNITVTGFLLNIIIWIVTLCWWISTQEQSRTNWYFIVYTYKTRNTNVHLYFSFEEQHIRNDYYYYYQTLSTPFSLCSHSILYFLFTVLKLFNNLCQIKTRYVVTQSATFACLSGFIGVLCRSLIFDPSVNKQVVSYALPKDTPHWPSCRDECHTYY